MVRRDDRADGHTLVEMAVAAAVLVIGLGGLFVAADRGTTHSNQAKEWLVAQESSRRPLTWLMDLVAETSIRHIDTTSRIANGGLGAANQYESDRFNLQGLRQCDSAFCQFHTGLDLQLDPNHYACSYEYRSGSGSNPVVRGKIWPPSVTACPFDGTSTSQGAAMDVLKMFVARDRQGDFATLPDGTPRWNAMVILAPRVEDGRCNLVRYDVFVEDLVEDTVAFSADWDRWDPMAPDMVELFDFGTDGTTDGIPDGTVPVTAMTSDASWEYFLPIAFSNGATGLVIRKYLTSGTVYRDVTVTINLDDGSVAYDFSHYETAAKYWTASGTFTRQPRVVATNLTELAISTSRSHPYDAVGNPTGVEEDGVVRVTMGTSRPVAQGGVRRWVHHVDTYAIRPRN